VPDPLWSPEAEREVLGSVLVAPSVLEEVADVLRPEDCYHVLNRRIFEAMLALHQDGGSGDPLRLVEHMEARGADRTRAWAHLNELQAGVGTSTQATHYAKIVRDRAILRGVSEVCTDAIHEARQLPEDVETYCCQTESRLRELSERGSVWRPQTAAQGVQEALEMIYACKAGDERVLGLLTGWRGIDEWTGGLPRGCVWLVARAESGKSSWCLQLMDRVASRGHGVYLWSGEMKERVWSRRIAARARLNHKSLVDRSLADPSDMQRAQDAAAQISELPILADYEPGLTADQVCLRAQRAQRELDKSGAPLRLVIVDHFHLLQHRNRHGERVDLDMGKSSGRFRDWSKGRGLTVVIAGQLNRGSERRMDNRPRASDIRECGAAEQDAEMILGLHQPWKHDQQAEVGQGECWVLKGRDLPNGLIPLYFDGPTMRWMDKL
jgi:replicative DNA helicase